MAWVEFTDDHDHRVSDASTIAYLKGMRCSVVHDCRDQAVALGRAVEIETPDQWRSEQLAADPFWRWEPEAAPEPEPAPDAPEPEPPSVEEAEA